MFPRTLSAAVLLLACIQASPAADKGNAFTDPAAAGPDFAAQGEYVGDDCGAQVIALGDGKFRVVGWSKGLPGTTDEAEKQVEVSGQREGNAIVFNDNGWKGDITDGVLSGTNADGATWKLKKTERKSPTLGAKPPAGAVVLFDGKNADAWEGGKVNAEGFLDAGTKSKQAFGDFSMHVEFRLPFMPTERGQGRGNSGVYLQDRYEVQVLDSFGLKGENNECGGIYTKHKPRINMCLPPLSWQTYDIEFEAAKFDASGAKTAKAKVTVKHNGVLIHDHAEIDGTTGGAALKETAAPGPIQFQNHGTPVSYRNIWIQPKG